MSIKKQIKGLFEAFAIDDKPVEDKEKGVWTVSYLDKNNHRVTSVFKDHNTAYDFLSKIKAGRVDETRMTTYTSKILSEIPLKRLGAWTLADGSVGLYRYEDGNAYEIEVRPISQGKHKDLWGNIIKSREERVEETLEPGSLNQFTGTEHYYKHPLSGYTYTDGVKYLATEGNAYWLIDKILITTKYKPKLQEFGVWKLKVADGVGMLACEDGNGHKLFSEQIPYTDFPLPEAEMWFENGVLILPSEH